MVGQRRARSRVLDLSAAAATSYSTRRRAVAAVLALLVVAGVVIYFSFFHSKDKKENMRLVGLNLQKQLHCYQDADCPDATYCGPAGLCLPREGLPPYGLAPSPVLGRGRDGEGADVQRTAPDCA